MIRTEKLWDTPVRVLADNIEHKLIEHSSRENTIWLIPVRVPNRGDHIHVGTTDPEKCEQGYGGAHIEFKLDRLDPDYDGIREVTLYGPWHTNACALYEDTGVDVRCEHFTRGVIWSKAMDDKAERDEGYNTILTEWLYKDHDWMIGSFGRVKALAQKLADKLGEKVYYFSQSTGGAIQSWANPTEVSDES